MKPWPCLLALAVFTSCEITPQAHTSDPVKAYERDVRRRMDVVWRRLAAEHIDRLSAGTAKVTFHIDPDGRVHDLKITSNTGPRALADVVTRTVRETRIPPIPPPVLAALPDRRMPAEFDFNIHE